MKLKMWLASLLLAAAPMAAGAVTLLDPLPDSDSASGTFNGVFAFSEDYTLNRSAKVQVIFTGTSDTKANLDNMVFSSVELGFSQGFDSVNQVGQLFEGTGGVTSKYGPGAFTIAWTNGGNVAGTTAQAGFTVIASPIPLPAAGWMLVSAIAGVGFLARRRNVAA